LTISKNFGGLKNFHELRNLAINKENIVWWIDVRKKKIKINTPKDIFSLFFFKIVYFFKLNYILFLFVC
jgi:hypothetical protein